MAAPSFHWRHSSMEDKMFWANSCACSGPQGGGPGSLFSWYTSLYSPLISPEEVLYPMSWTVGTSAPGSSLRVPCWQPQQITHSISFCPNSAVCRNILWEDEWLVGSTSLPLWIFIEKQVHIQAAFHLPNRQPITFCQPFGGQRLMPLITMLQFQ